MQRSRWEMKKTVWKTYLSSNRIKTGELEHALEVCQKLPRGSSNLKFNSGTRIGPLEASALGGNMQSP